MTEGPDQNSQSPRPRKSGKSPRNTGPAATSDKRRVIVVLGMHRSGTSVVTRGLQTLGIDLGENLMKPAESNNEKGFFEDMDLNRHNERLLSLSRSAWHFLGPLNEAALAGAEFSAERRAAAAILSAKLSDDGVFAFKDPRTAVLMPFWRCVFEDLDLDDRYIIVVRHPLESAASLENRDRIALTKGVTLWAKHTIEAIRQSAGKPRVFVRFDRMLKAPEAELRRIASILQLPAAAHRADAMRAFRDEFLSPDLRHHMIGRNELRRSGTAPAFVVELYETLLELIDKDPEGASIDADFWRGIEARYEEAAPLLRHADNLDTSLRETSQRLAAQEKRAAAAESELGALKKAAEEATQRSIQAQAESEGLKQLQAATAAQVAEAKATVERLTIELAESHRRVDDANSASQQQLSQAKDEIQSELARAATLQEALAQRDDDVRRLTQDLTGAREALAAAQARAAFDAAQSAELEAYRRNADQNIAELLRALEEQRQIATKAQEALLADLETVRLRAASDAALSAEREQRLREDAQRISEQAVAQLQEALEAQRLAAAAALAAVQAEIEAIRTQAATDSALNSDLEQRLQEASHISSAQEIAQLTEALEAQRLSSVAAQAALYADLEAARAQADTDSALNSELEQRLRESAQFISERTITQLRADLEALHASAASTQEALQADLHTVRVQAAKDAANNAEVEAHLREELARAGHQKTASLQAEIDKLVAASKAAQEQGAADSARLHKQLAVAEDAARTLRDRLAEAEIGLAGARLEQSVIQGELDTLLGAHENLERKRRGFRRDMLLARSALTQIRQTLSWRITAPLRAGSRFVRRPLSSTRALAGRAARFAWRCIPLPAEQRGKIASRVFAAAPVLFSWSSAFKAWRGGQSAPSPASARGDDSQEPSPDPSLEGYVPLTAHAAPATVAARAIAFYLPQFHPIPENDAWWGEGFTEWTKVRAAQPRFEGHYQPHEPDEALGYYDLIQQPETMAQQAALAKLHGISGFCFYFYWFAGKRLLETPLQNLLNDKSIDLPFCLCWANENWSRRWDGKAYDVLIAQKHSEADDLAFIKHVSQYLGDPRYIRIDGKPLLLVYRPALLPSAKHTAARWRRWLRENGFGEVYLAYTQSFERTPPEAYGFDAAIEFPPNNLGLVSEPALVKPFDGAFRHSIYDGRKLVSRSRNYETPPYKLFRGVTPAWDNTARRPNDSAVLINTSPTAFQAWLTNAVRDTEKCFANAEERLIFINAWNEWAEGAHLEPDKRHGYAWLEAARRALDPCAERPRVLVVTHDLARHGAQYLALDIARRLRTQFGCDVACISGEDGPLADAFKAEGPLHVFDIKRHNRAAIEDGVKALAAQGYCLAIINSAASAWIAPLFAKHGIAHIGLVHELPGVLRQRGLTEPLKALNESARALVFPAAIVRDQAREACALPAWRNAVVRPQGLYAASTLADPREKEQARKRIAARLDAPEDARFVLGVGYADHRKGIDIFFAWANAAAKRWPDLHFIWVGDTPPDESKALAQHCAQARRDGVHLHMIPFTDDLADFYAGAALYALSSREDPFPSVTLEALAQATPVLMIEGAGGIQDLAQEGCVAVTAMTPSAFVQAAARWLDDPAALRAAGLAGRDIIRTRFGAASYVGALTDLLGLNRPNISVIVPNYNYARHLEQRLSSILEQTLSPREIIFLDDASTDESIAVAERVLSKARVNWRIIRNESNSGSAFAQWRKGVELARGDLIWIAEADDWSDPHFLEAAVKPFQRPGIVLSMTQSKQADSAGAVIAPDYLDYVRDVSAHRWTRAFTAPGPDEVRDGLSIKNTIPNVSAALFSRPEFLSVMTRHAQEIASYRVAGDWCVYVNLLREGDIAFNPSALNYHRRHNESVTISRFGLAELAEIARMQAYVARHFGVSAEQERQAHAYLQTLVAQFALEKRWSPAQIEGAMRGIVAA